MAIKAGTKKTFASGEDQFTGSMAAAMENAFVQEWPLIMGTDAPPPNDHMRLLFIAVAQGVIRHLKDNENSITLTTTINGIIDTNIATEGILY